MSYKDMFPTSSSDVTECAITNHDRDMKLLDIELAIMRLQRKVDSLYLMVDKLLLEVTRRVG